jgi:Zn-dependent M16 (insulinase) family peptidase
VSAYCDVCVSAYADTYGCANSRYVSSVLRLLYLCRQVRVVGGAYGCANSFNPQTGMFKYTSYRDPNVMSTLKTYDATPSFLSHTATEMSQATLSNAIIGMIGDLDSPMQPDAKGFASMERHLSGMTDQLRQERRDQVNLKCTCFTRANSTAVQTLTLHKH